jgi:glycogen phosphorylase
MEPFEEDRSQRKIAYFSMEVAIEESIPTYSGGLGALAADMLRSAADLSVPVVGITLLQRKGYFRQRLSPEGVQSEEEEHWQPATLLYSIGRVGTIQMEGRTVALAAWRYLVQGVGGHIVPLYFVDADLPENDLRDRALTGRLYGGDARYRLAQEVLLGIGGLAALEGLGYTNLQTFHMNEGHSALLSLALLEEEMGATDHEIFTGAHLDAVRRKCVFTTHTPVPAGHDRFPKDMVSKMLGSQRARLLDVSGCYHDGGLNMTYLALRCSHYINGVAMQHGEVSRNMFPGYSIRAITNGVHAVTWSAPALHDLYDRHIPEWRRDNIYLRYVVGVSLDEIGEAHRQAKQALIAAVKGGTGHRLDEHALTIGFGRRAATYKRLDLLFSDIERLRSISRHAGPIQVVYGGKAHPQDGGGKDAIRHVFEAAGRLARDVSVVYLENYDVNWAKLITAGVDLWLNTPQRPFEASGTSGMKAAMNGVPSLSVLDGWWIEGCIEGVTGWAIGTREAPADPAGEIASLYGKLEWVILPMYYGRPEAYLGVMRSVIALNGAFFNTQRMLSQYMQNAYDQEVASADVRDHPAAAVGVE